VRLQQVDAGGKPLFDEGPADALGLLGGTGRHMQPKDGVGRQIASQLGLHFANPCGGGENQARRGIQRAAVLPRSVRTSPRRAAVHSSRLCSVRQPPCSQLGRVSPSLGTSLRSSCKLGIMPQPQGISVEHRVKSCGAPEE
jgi:hypothetical protein